MVEWVEDLERRVTQRPPKGATTAERVINVLRRALSAMEREPKLTAAVLSALTSADEQAGRCSLEVTDVMNRIMLHAFPESVDAATEAAITKVLGHVWFSCLISWANGVDDIAWVGNELEKAAHLLLDQYE
jgi:hypothetical protein